MGGLVGTDEREAFANTARRARRVSRGEEVFTKEVNTKVLDEQDDMQSNDEQMGRTGGSHLQVAGPQTLFSGNDGTRAAGASSPDVGSTPCPLTGRS